MLLCIVLVAWYAYLSAYAVISTIFLHIYISSKIVQTHSQQSKNIFVKTERKNRFFLAKKTSFFKKKLQASPFHVYKLIMDECGKRFEFFVAASFFLISLKILVQNKWFCYFFTHILRQPTAIGECCRETQLLETKQMMIKVKMSKKRSAQQWWVLLCVTRGMIEWRISFVRSEKRWTICMSGYLFIYRPIQT